MLIRMKKLDSLVARNVPKVLTAPMGPPRVTNRKMTNKSENKLNMLTK
jgi:hypothetical protein